MIFAPVIRSSAHFNGLRAMDRNLERFLAQALRAPASQGPETRARVESTEQGYRLQLDLPGLAREHLQIDIEGSTVRLDSAVDAPRRYQARYELPQELDASASSARLEHGVLTLELARKAPVPPQATRLTIQ